MISISLKCVPKDQNNNNIPALVQMMAWRRPGDIIIWTNDVKFTGAYI